MIVLEITYIPIKNVILFKKGGKMDNKNKVKIIVIVVFILLIAIFYFTNNKEESYENIYISNDIINNSSENLTISEKVEKIKIHIIGEVKMPGIYELEFGSRIQDAIIAAGGETENAALDDINLAYQIEDGQKICIPSIFEQVNAYIYNDSGENVIVDDENESSGNVKVNINKASSEELQQINGVGPSLAEKIILYREQNGKFKNIEELKNVSGIGDKKYEALEEYVTIK